MNNFGNQGWECPKCGAVMSPLQMSCVNCKGKTSHINDIKYYGNLTSDKPYLSQTTSKTDDDCLKTTIIS